MNIPPQTRERIIKKILDSFFELICNDSRSSIEHPIDGYTYDQLKEMDDKYLELILMDLEEYTPYYIANHPLNHSDADANFEWWTKCPYWTLDEAVALLFGKNPKIVNWESVNKADVRFVPFVAEYKKITELAERYEKVGELKNPLVPGLFLNWAKEMLFPMPEGLLLKGEITTRPEVKKEKMGNEDIDLMKSDYFQSLVVKAKKTIKEYPQWRKNLKEKVQKSGNLQEWIIKTCGSDNREAEILKKILSDLFVDLQ